MENVNAPAKVHRQWERLERVAILAFAEQAGYIAYDASVTSNATIRAYARHFLHYSALLHPHAASNPHISGRAVQGFLNGWHKHAYDPGAPPIWPAISRASLSGLLCASLSCAGNQARTGRCKLVCKWIQKQALVWLPARRQHKGRGQIGAPWWSVSMPSMARQTNHLAPA